MVSTYAAFLENKAALAPASGIDIDDDAVNWMLHPWQRQIVRDCCRIGRAAIFADCGLGKTFMQLEWARLISHRTLIVAPLSVARQTVNEAKKLYLDVTYARTGDEVDGDGIWITNYEMADKFDPATFDAVVLDESSILKNATGVMRNRLITQWADTKYRLACTATPAPNDITELTNHAEFLGHMPRNEMLAAWFIHDNDGWRIKGHARGPLFRWMSSWAIAARFPSDVGGDDTGYRLPALTIVPEVVHVDNAPEGQLFATELGGIGGRSQVRRFTLDDRVGRAVDIASRPGQWIVWCGLNDEADQVAAAVDGAVNVDGAMDPDDKADTFEAFQDSKVRVLVTKPAIAGFGMNFQNAHQMIFVGISDSYERYYQSIRRCWRFGQSEPVDVHIVVSDLESQIVTNVRNKEREASKMTAELVANMRGIQP